MAADSRLRYSAAGCPAMTDSPHARAFAWGLNFLRRNGERPHCLLADADFNGGIG